MKSQKPMLLAKRYTMRLTTHLLELGSMNNLQSSDTERRLEALKKEIELLKQAAKHRGRVLTALSLIIAALAVPVVILVPLLSSDWSYAVEDGGKVSFHITSREVDWGWLNSLFPPSSMGVLLIAAALSLTGQGDKVGLLLARYMQFMISSPSIPEHSTGERDQ
jgi:hypothetical protein